MSNDPNNNHDEVLPTQNVSSDADILQAAQDIQVPQNPTTELVIVSFYLPERSEPIIVSGAKLITIGRRDPKRRINPTLDLTEDNGAKLGVSRMHAEMNFINGRYYIKDTGSSNGTWVNDTKLAPYQPHPVTNADQIRIGQLAITVHVTLPQRSATKQDDVISTLIDSSLNINVHSYRLVDNTGGILVENGAMVLSKLRNLSTYLERVSRIHQVISEAQQQEYKPLAVVAIRVRRIDDSIIIDIEDGMDIMDFMANKFDDFVTVVDGTVKGSQKQTDSLNRYSDPMEQIADYALQELVFRFLNEARDDYVKKLAVHFDAILGLDLRIKQTTS